MKSELIMAVNQICAEKDLPKQVILGAIEEALMHAYRRNYASNNAVVQAQIDGETGELRVLCEKTVVEEVQDAGVEISLADARKLDPAVEIGGTVYIEKTPGDFGRIAAQTAKQVILQRIHEAERDAIYDIYHQKEGELITGTVQSIDYRSNQVTITLGKKTEGILAGEDQLPNDKYRIGQNVRCLMAEVAKGARGPQIRLSRTHRNMLRRLLEREIPEIFSGAVEIKGIAREPGQRSKVAVVAMQSGVDPVGSCVGMKGTRIQNIVDELGGEKIDVIEWSGDSKQLISNALSPARPTETVLLEEGDARTAIVIVPDRQLSLAIGKEGQNARLAAKLTGWRIDIKSETEAASEGIAEIKRLGMQVLKARALEAKAAAAPPSDDLLGRAEWLLREKDRSAVTLEQAAARLAAVPTEPAPAETEAEAVVSIEAAPAVVEAAAPPVAPIVTPPPAKPSDTILPPLEAFDAAPSEAGEDEGEDTAEGRAKRQKSKKTSKKREFVFDETLGEVVVRRKRKPGRAGWGGEEFE
ncbi:MAG: transcription termination factor NusA [Chloroflexi bacterium]|nr:transcription termination factor NusA [Chloroflexota bacterium]